MALERLVHSVGIATQQEHTSSLRLRKRRVDQAESAQIRCCLGAHSVTANTDNTARIRTRLFVDFPSNHRRIRTQLAKVGAASGPHAPEDQVVDGRAAERGSDSDEPTQADTCHHQPVAH
jgi:hypothetical protein